MPSPNKTFRRTSTADTNKAVAVESDATLNGIIVANGSAEARYVKLYNKASAPALGSDTPVIVVACPAANTIQLQGINESFSKGIALAITKKQVDTNEEAVAAGDVSLTLQYT